jgi:MFS family permease
MNLMGASQSPSPFSIPNVRRFIAFRAFFNARFYYPVFTILFLDFGLTLSQFALLNVVWAATIVLVEVPSGALADIWGRRNLLVFSGALMVLEMAVLCLAPRGHPHLLFGAFLLNRVLSGTAEAAASGADEALAYDTLKHQGDVQDWGRVLDVQMRVQSTAYIVVMSLGAAVYDPELMKWLVHWMGFKILITQETTLRFPAYMTLLSAVLTLLSALGMREVYPDESQTGTPPQGCGESIAKAFRLTLDAGRWILKTPFALIIILAGLLFDHVIRMLITMNSQYYRLIHLPEASFGLIGSALAGLGLFVPRLALQLAQKRSPVFNLGLLAGVTLLGLMGMSRFLPFYGLLPIVALMAVMYCINFLVSHYLNKITDSQQRATVLSFKGLSYNLAYGLIGLLYSLLLLALRLEAQKEGAPGSADSLKDVVFVKSIAWFPGYFTLILACLLLYAHWRLKGTGRQGVAGIERG